MIVYLLRNRTSGKGYVGKTKRNLEQRWREHVYNAMIGRREMTLYAAIRKHGQDDFEHAILQECSSEGELDEAEKYWIVRLKTFGDGYNMTAGGEGLRGYRHTETTKRRMSEQRRGKRLGPASEEHKRNISKGKMGTGTGPRPHVRGRHHSEDARTKISQSQYIRVVQLDMMGMQIAEFDSMLHAEQVSGVGRQGISRACRFSHRSAGGYRWRYAESEKIEGYQQHGLP